MKRENDEITNLFRSRLSDVEMPVRDGFWEELNKGVADSRHHRRLIFFRVTAAASVLLVLAASSAAFWYFSPKEDIEQAFTQIAVANTGALDGDVVKQEFRPIQAEPILQKPTSRPSAWLAQTTGDEDDSTSVTLSMSFSFSMSSSVRQGSERDNRRDAQLWQAGTETEQTTATVEQESPAAVLNKGDKPHRWSLKAAIGTALPADKGTCKMPVSTALTVQRQLNKYLALETGLQYTHLRGADQKLHYLGIPVKMNVTLADTKKFDFYATVGGILDKCIAGATNNSFQSEPVQLALTGGIGMNYQVNDRIALFVEPGVSHHFKTDSGLKTVRTERPTNFNLICGLRMTY